MTLKQLIFKFRYPLLHELYERLKILDMYHAPNKNIVFLHNKKDAQKLKKEIERYFTHIPHHEYYSQYPDKFNVKLGRFDLIINEAYPEGYKTRGFGKMSIITSKHAYGIK